jgi:hypothetical protein
LRICVHICVRNCVRNCVRVAPWLRAQRARAQRARGVRAVCACAHAQRADAPPLPHKRSLARRSFMLRCWSAEGRYVISLSEARPTR